MTAPRVLFVAGIGSTLKQFVEPLSVRLADEGIETSAAAAGVGTLGGFTRKYELPAYRRRGVRAAARALRVLSSVIEQEQPHLLHLHTPPALVVGRIAARRHGLPAVAVVHGTFLDWRDPRSAIYRSVEATLGRLATRTVTVNDEDALFYRRIARAGTVDVAPVGGIGLDVGRVRTAIEQRGERTGQPALVSVGRLTPDKNHPLLVEAFLRFRENHPAATLTFVGSALSSEPGWSVPSLGGIHHLPWVDDPYPMMARADLLVTASPREGFSMAVAEALALGTPVAAVTNRGTRQLDRTVKEGLFLAPSNSDDLCRAMHRALAHGPGAAERERLTGLWSTETAVAFHRRVILEAIQQHRSQR